MLNALIIALTLAAPAASSPDIAASDAMPKPIEHMSIYDQYLKRIKDSDENGWKYSIREWDAMFNRRAVVPELYIDPIKGSNGGLDWA